MNDFYEAGYVYRPKAGVKHRVIRREGRVVMAESDPGGSFEVFRLEFRERREICGTLVEASMSPPGSREWGSSRGVTIMDREEAEARFDQWVQEDCDAC